MGTFEAPNAGDRGREERLGDLPFGFWFLTVAAAVLAAAAVYLLIAHGARFSREQREARERESP